ncbi:MAG: methylmalonyl-CoA mutase family protein, partial [Candidatus Bathyarchaeota archaeon]|nr:methylmalonyl-CoA mutase family protein [Candidatus Bathyarchaeota archaeon]
QQIIAHESGVADTVDPLAGSYCIEALTNEMEERAMDYINKIDDMGGVIPAIENGFLQKEIADSAYKYQQEIDNKERTLVGVNDYTIEEDWVPLKILRIPPGVEAEQLARLQKVKRERNNARVRQVLDKLYDAADRDENLMPTIIEAVKDYATLGEITSVLRSVFGEYRELIVI